jgi:hypothetical protein
MRVILTEAAAVGDATARALTYRYRQAEAYYYPDSAWRTVFLGGYRFQVSPAEEVKMVGAGSQMIWMRSSAAGYAPSVEVERAQAAAPRIGTGMAGSSSTSPRSLRRVGSRRSTTSGEAADNTSLTCAAVAARQA